MDTQSVPGVAFGRMGGGFVVVCALAVGFPFMASCERRGIEETVVPKSGESVPTESEASSLDEGFPAEAAAMGQWVVPEGWVLDPEPRPMRRATYIAPDAGGEVEVAITAFPGRVGGELANVNRWRGQMGLEPVDAAQLETLLERFATEGYEGYQIRIESRGGVMLAAGVYEAALDQTWFVRATVDDAEAASRVEGDLFGLARSMAGLDVRGGG